MSQTIRKDGKEASSGIRNENVLANVALMYYKDGLTQSQIARRIRVSRATVVNYLRMARELGIVDIRIEGSAFRTSHVSREMREKYDLVDVYVADNTLLEKPANLPINNGKSTITNTVIRQVARVGASALVDFVKPGGLLGIAWGETIHQLAKEVPRHPVADLTICQMIGAMESPLVSAAESSAIRIAGNLNANCHTLHSPAILSSPELAAALHNEPTIRSQLERFRELDQSVFSVGHCEADTHLVQSGIATDDQVKWYRQQGAVGILCGRFIDINGNSIEGELDTRLVGIHLRDLQSCSAGLLVASGISKAPAIHASLVGGFANHLVIDETTARYLLSYDPAR